MALYKTMRETLVCVHGPRCAAMPLVGVTLAGLARFLTHLDYVNTEEIMMERLSHQGARWPPRERVHARESGARNAGNQRTGASSRGTS